VPNVFTPNDDDKNPVMKVQTNSTIYRFSIFNRFGDEIYSNSSGEWDGGAAPAGVYFWYLKYNGCEEQKELRGWVQVFR
jgi:gliding motility-associated-like protein